MTRPTRQGWIVLACAGATALLGRVFGVLELYIIAAALLTAGTIGLVVRGATIFPVKSTPLRLEDQ